MKITFRGWEREVCVHEHLVTPANHGGLRYMRGKEGAPLTWHSELCAFGAIQDLALTGNFFVELEFMDEELLNWLRAYVAAKPAEALKILASMQAEAVLALTNTTTT